MRFTEEVKARMDEVRAKREDVSRRKFEDRMRKMDASAQKLHNKTAKIQELNKAKESLLNAKRNAKLSKIRYDEEAFNSSRDKRLAKQQRKQVKFNDKINKRELKYQNQVNDAKSKTTKKLQSAVIDVIDGKPVDLDMLKYAKGSPVYRALLKIKQGFTIGKENRELAAIRAEMMSTNPLKREVAIKKFARSIDKMAAMQKEKIKDYAAKRDRKAKLGEAAIKYGSMLGSASAISGALSNMYGGNDDDETE